MPDLLELPAFFLISSSSGKILKSVLQCGWHIKGAKVKEGKPMNRLCSRPGSRSQGGGRRSMRHGMMKRSVGFGGEVDKRLNEGEDGRWLFWKLTNHPKSSL